MGEVESAPRGPLTTSTLTAPRTRKNSRKLGANGRGRAPVGEGISTSLIGVGFYKGTANAHHGPYSSPEGSVAGLFLLNGYASAAGPAFPQRSSDDLVAWSCAGAAQELPESCPGAAQELPKKLSAAQELPKRLSAAQELPSSCELPRSCPGG